MNILSLKNGVQAFVFALPFFFLCSTFVFAQETPPHKSFEDAIVSIPESEMNENDSHLLSEKNIVASIEISNFEVKSQSNNVFDLAFDITSKFKISPNIVYSVNLRTQDRTTIVHQKVFDADPLNLVESSSIHRNISYTAPASLNGTYSINIEARDINGGIVTFSSSDEVILSGSNENVFIHNKTCLVSIEGKPGEFNLTQGVDITDEESLVLRCLISSGAKTETTVIPVFETRYRSTHGKIAGMEVQTPVQIKAGESIFTAKIPKVSSPQAYNAAFTLTNTDGEPISNKIDVHYVLHGVSATIGSVTLDSTYYAPGSTALLNIGWTGPAGNFPDARIEPIALPQGSSLSVTILNEKGESCIADFNKQLTTTNSIEHLEIPIIVECVNPDVSIQIIDSSKNTLAESSFSLLSDSSMITAVENPSSAQTKITFEMVLLVSSVLLLMVALISRVIARRKSASIQILPLLIMVVGIGLFSIVNEAYADAVSGSVPYQSYGGTSGVANMTASYVLDKTTVSPGESITVHGTASFGACLNTLAGGLSVVTTGAAAVSSFQANEQWLVSGYYQRDGAFPAADPDHAVWQTVITPVTFTAPSTPGTYKVTIKHYYSVYQPSYATQNSWVVNSTQVGGGLDYGAIYFNGSANLTYTVVAAPVQPVNCTLPWGGTLANGSSVTAYLASSGTTCTSQTRTCTNFGTLSGTYQYQSCTVAAATNCTNQAQTWTVSSKTCSGTTGATTNGSTVIVASTNGNAGQRGYACNAATGLYTAVGPGTCGQPAVCGDVYGTGVWCNFGTNLVTATPITTPPGWNWTCKRPIPPSAPTFSCQAYNPNPPQPPSDCGATTIDGCILPATSSGSSAGSCTTGTTGSCNYSCSNGTWTESTTNPNSCIPTEPTGFSAATGATCGTGIINLSWSPVTGASGYDIQKDSIWGTNIGNVSSYQSTGLIADTSHTYRVRAWNVNGSGVASALQAATAPSACAGSCTAQTIGNCTLPATSSGSSAGSCPAGWAGSCSYSCTNGSWSQNSDTCTIPTISEFKVCDVGEIGCVSSGEKLVNLNTPFEIYWDAQSASFCTAISGPGFSTASSTSGMNTATSGSVPGVLSSYTIACGNNGNIAVSRSIDVREGGTPTISVSPRVVQSGNNVKISWDTNGVADPSTCSISGGTLNMPSLSAQTGEVSTPVTARTTYTITCGTLHKSVTVEVAPQSFET